MQHAEARRNAPVTLGVVEQCQCHAERERQMRIHRRAAQLRERAPAKRSPIEDRAVNIADGTDDDRNVVHEPGQEALGH